MNNKLEETFFDTFGIEPIGCNDNKNCTGTLDCTQCPNAKYPQITDRMLLELIFLQPLSIEFKYPRNIEELKNTLLGYYIEELSLFAEPSEAEIFKQQVQALFKEDNNNDR